MTLEYPHEGPRVVMVMLRFVWNPADLISHNVLINQIQRVIPRQIVNLLFIMTNKNMKMTVLWGSGLFELTNEYVVSDETLMPNEIRCRPCLEAASERGGSILTGLQDFCLKAQTSIYSLDCVMCAIFARHRGC